MIRPTIAQIAALDNRIEDVLRNIKGPMRLGEIAKMSRVAEMAAYHQVVTALRRLHAAGRITVSGTKPNTLYTLAPGSERMVPVASEPKLGDRVWIRTANGIERGTLVAIIDRYQRGRGYWVEQGKPEVAIVDSVTLDGCRLVREIEQEEPK